MHNVNDRRPGDSTCGLGGLWYSFVLPFMSRYAMGTTSFLSVMKFPVRTTGYMANICGLMTGRFADGMIAKLEEY
jgi:hypothetical protein